ncbi:uncharacterized protein LOC134212882 [Armigeres subalbatus]|uniref:uncharacterized protein LOC134212882 n=1 Tax=Armigeres subalbatus TaxID=124917 RepID=UPI002ED2C4A1
MLEIEEVIVDENEADYDETDYPTHDQTSPKTQLSVPRFKFNLNLPKSISVKKSSSPTIVNESRKQASQVVRKVPIIRKPGEVVTPSRKPAEVVKVSSSTLEIPALVRSRSEYSNALPHDSKTPLTAVKFNPTDDEVLSGSVSDAVDEFPQDDHVTQHQNSDQWHKHSKFPESGDTEAMSKLTRIEQLLEQVVAKQEEHDAALKTLKFGMKHLRADLKNTANKAVVYARETSYQPIPVKRERKRLVVFPVADDNYLLQLEDLVRDDGEIQEDVISLFGDATTKSAYDFLRKNVELLFAHTSKYTWTGKSSHNNAANVQAHNPANQLAIVDVLITCGCDKFPHLGRDAIKSEFRRALANFNESRMARLKRGIDKSAIEMMDEGEHSSG